MDQRNAGRAFADCSGNALRAARAYVSHGEHSRQAGFVLGLWARANAGLGNACPHFWARLVTRSDEALVVELEAPL